jgi:hypothetical protein
MHQVVMMQYANSLVVVWPESDTSDTEDDADIVRQAVANCPTRVAVYVPGIDNPAVELGARRRILVPYVDGSPHASDAVAMALQLARGRPHVTIHVLVCTAGSGTATPRSTTKKSLDALGGAVSVDAVDLDQEALPFLSKIATDVGEWPGGVVVTHVDCGRAVDAVLQESGNKGSAHADIPIAAAALGEAPAAVIDRGQAGNDDSTAGVTDESLSRHAGMHGHDASAQAHCLYRVLMLIRLASRRVAGCVSAGGGSRCCTSAPSTRPRWSTRRACRPSRHHKTYTHTMPCS